jgi:hypothetical protein
MDYSSLFNSFEINPHYLNRYLKFVLNCTPNLNNYTEEHHILPKSLFPDFKTDPRNLVRLTARQHFIAHWILSKVFIKYKQKCSMLKAFNRMTTVSKTNSGRLTVSSKLFELAKLANSTAMKLLNPMHDQNTVFKMKESWKLFIESPEGLEYRQRRSASQKGVQNKSPEGLKRLSDLWLGVPRPQTKNHTELIRKATSLGDFITPFGTFDSPNQAALSELNVDKLSRYQINRLCKEGINGFLFQSNGRVNKRGLHKMTIQNL